MAMHSLKQDDEKIGLFALAWLWLLNLPENVRAKACDVANNVKKLGKDDPRTIIHSLKVGVSISLVSIFYYYQPFYDNFGVSAMWAVMTVVVVFEYTVGATLGKGLNRGLATLLAGALGVGAHHLAGLSGHIGEPILLGFFVFVQAAASTFIRFFPKVKARYDYGLVIFILTFCLISVSGFREDEILEMAHKRLSTILIGASACVVFSILVCPVWAGEDLHNLIALNLEKLGNFLEGFGGEYFRTTMNEESNKDNNKVFLQEYKTVLNSKSSEESLANFARWEPGHGKFQFRHPWKQYLVVGTLTRQCAYRIEALHGRLNADLNQASPEIREQIQEACMKISLESGKALKELATCVKKMKKPSSANPHIASSKAAAKSLKSLLKSGSWDNIDLLEVIPSVTVASILLDVVNCIEKVAESVHELASLANFKTGNIIIDPNVSPEMSPLEKSDVPDTDRPEQNHKKDCPDHVVITITESAPTLHENGKPQGTTYVGV